MSGGSYNYLYCSADNDLDFLIERTEDLERMCDRLKTFSNSDLATNNSRNILKLLRDIESDTCNHRQSLILHEVEKLCAVWKAVEFFDSKDVDFDNVASAIDDFNHNQIDNQD